MESGLGHRPCLNLMKTGCFKTPCSEIIEDPKPGVGSEPISGMFSMPS